MRGLMGDAYLRDDAPWTIAGLLHDRADRLGARVAMEVAGEERSYEALESESGRLAAGFAALGVARGDRVALLLRNSVENVDCWFAIVRLGAVEVPINSANRGHLLRYIIQHSGACVVVVEEDLVEQVLPLLPDLPELKHVVIRQVAPGTPHLGRVGPVVHSLRDLYVDGPAVRDRVSPDDLAVILYTSGTTGPSKGVMLSHRANLVAVRHNVWLGGYSESDVLFTVFPLFHINAKYTSVLASIEAGARLLMETQFSASSFIDTCRERGITAFNYMGALLTMLMKQPERSDDAENPVRVAFGAPAPVELWEPFERRFGVTLLEVYGMTETSTSLMNTVTSRRVGSAGRPVQHFEVEIHDEEDRRCPPGLPGEIVVRPRLPDVMFRGYFGMPDATLTAFRNLWFHTGDRGVMDADGWFFFIDRMKDCIRRRGENISSFEVEQVVNTHEAVLESAAFGVPSELTEEEVMVAVVLRPGRSLDLADLIAHCREGMAHFAVPRYLRLMDELPKTPSQRVQKYLLRQEGLTSDTWDRESDADRAGAAAG